MICDVSVVCHVSDVIDGYVGLGVGVEGLLCVRVNLT